MMILPVCVKMRLPGSAAQSGNPNGILVLTSPDLNHTHRTPCDEFLRDDHATSGYFFEII